MMMGEGLWAPMEVVSEGKVLRLLENWGLCPICQTSEDPGVKHIAGMAPISDMEVFSDYQFPYSQLKFCLTESRDR